MQNKRALRKTSEKTRLLSQNKRGQMMLWVIVAIVIVAGAIILIAVKLKTPQQVSQIYTPNSYIEKCVRDNVLAATEEMMPQGGFVNPESYKLYQNTKIEYLCLNIGYYKSCINQHPSLFNEEKDEIKNYITPKMENCFASMKSERAKSGEQIDYGPMSIEVSLAPGKVIVNINRKTTITKNGDTTSFNNYNSEVETPLYGLVNVAVEIASQESKYCYFEYVGYMILHPQFDITKYTMSDSTKIYTIEDKDSKKKFNMAIRSCAIPAGI